MVRGCVGVGRGAAQGWRVEQKVLRKKDEKHVADDAPSERMTESAEDGPSLEPQLQAQIGRKLKAMYDSYLSEPVPDRLVSLLEQLDEMSSQREQKPREGNKS